MKIQGSFQQGLAGVPSASGVQKVQKQFKEVLTETQNLAAVTEMVLNQKKLDPKDLLRAQLAVGHHNLRVELASKMTETLASIPRRLQQG